MDMGLSLTIHFCNNGSYEKNIVKYGKLIKAIIRTETINTQTQKNQQFF